MIAYQYNEKTGELIKGVSCQESPLEPGKHLLPNYCTTVTPLDYKEGFTQIFNGLTWEYKKVEKEKTNSTFLEFYIKFFKFEFYFKL
jgi:hypothetical protein